MARKHWQSNLPDAYRRISDPDRFFLEIENEAADQLLEIEESLRGEELPGETWVERMGRYQRARQVAEEVVVREVILSTPEPSQAASDGCDDDLQDALDDFQRFRERAYAEIDATTARNDVARTSEVTDTLHALQRGEVTIEDVEARFRARDWPRRESKQPRTAREAFEAEQTDRDPDPAGSFAEVAQAFYAGIIDNATYERLANAVRGSADT